MNYLFTVNIPFHKSSSCSPILFVDFKEEVPQFWLSFIGFKGGTLNLVLYA
jgi:hypothetical protein